ncbi:MAG: type II toxin-antitoxin system RelE/ParE family toxin [Patescibacteria group bacterium]
MDYYFKPFALRDLRKLPKPIQKRIIKKLDYFTSTNKPLSFASALKDKNVGSYRYRIGDYRVIFDVVNNSIIVLAVGHRREIYN